jgi:hypothetical protein
VYPAPIGFPYGLQLVTTTAYTSPVAADTVSFSQVIEQINFQDALFGTANAQPLVVEFWVGASIAGNYGFSLCSASPYRSYVTSFNVPTANVWTKIRINIPADTGGTVWSPAVNGVGLYVRFSLLTGSTYQTSTTNTWQDGNFLSPPGTVNVLATNGAVFTITGVALMVGAPAGAEPAFPKYSENLLDCQRYYQKLGGDLTATILLQAVATAGGQQCSQSIRVAPQMRAPPTATFVNLGTWNSVNAQTQALYAGSAILGLQVASVNAGQVTFYNNANTQSITLDADL